VDPGADGLAADAAGLFEIFNLPFFFFSLV